MGLCEAGVVLDRFAADVARSHHDDDGEDAEVHEDVDQQVQHDAGDAVWPSGDQAEQYESGVRDAGIGQHALDVGLHEGDETAKRHGQHRDHGDDNDPDIRRRGHGVEEDAQQDGEGGGLRPHRHEGGDGRRCPLVDVRHPHVERHRADLENQAGDQEHRRQHQRRVVRAP